MLREEELREALLGTAGSAAGEQSSVLGSAGEFGFVLSALFVLGVAVLQHGRFRGASGTVPPLAFPSYARCCLLLCFVAGA
jgi:hypothetical protein